MASPAVRSLLGKSKIPLPFLIRGTALSSAEPVFFCPKVVVPPPLPSVCLRKEFLFGSGEAWALGRIGGVSAGEDGLKLAGRRPAVNDEDDEGEEVDEDEWDDDDDDLKGLDDSEDFDDDEDDDDDSEDDEDEVVPHPKSK